jgi:hypothetical protein
MGHQEARSRNRLWKVTRLFEGPFQLARTCAGGRAALTLWLAMGSAVALTGQTPSVEVPVTALGNHIVQRGSRIFITTQYPVEVEDDQGNRMVAQANSFIDCNAGEKGKDALGLDGCRMVFQAVGGDKYYRCKVQGNSLSIRWSHYSFLDFIGNASEEWQGALGGFAVAQTTSLFTPRHTLLALAAGFGYGVTGAGPLVKHHPSLWLWRRGGTQIPDNKPVFLTADGPELKLQEVKELKPPGGQATKETSSGMAATAAQ